MYCVEFSTFPKTIFYVSIGMKGFLKIMATISFNQCAGHIELPDRNR